MSSVMVSWWALPCLPGELWPWFPGQFRSHPNIQSSTLVPWWALPWPWFRGQLLPYYSELCPVSLVSSDLGSLCLDPVSPTSSGPLFLVNCKLGSVVSLTLVSWVELPVKLSLCFPGKSPTWLVLIRWSATAVYQLKSFRSQVWGLIVRLDRDALVSSDSGFYLWALTLGFPCELGAR
jgi:hypothetical protein